MGDKLYIIQCTSLWEMSNSIWGIPLIYKLSIHKVYLLLRDAKLLMRDSIYKLYINTVYLLRREAKLHLRDSIYKLKINISFWGVPTSFWGIPCQQFWGVYFLMLSLSKDIPQIWSFSTVDLQVIFPFACIMLYIVYKQYWNCNIAFFFFFNLFSRIH